MSGHKFGRPASIAIALGSILWTGTATAQARFEIRGYVPVRCSSTAFAPVSGSEISLAADTCNSLDRVTLSMTRQRFTTEGLRALLMAEPDTPKSGEAPQKDAVIPAQAATSIVQVITVSL
jgi:hypothetical protein